MNIIDAVVTQIDSKPFERHGKWWVEATIDAYGRTSKTTKMFSSESEALKFSAGQVVQV